MPKWGGKINLKEKKNLKHTIKQAVKYHLLKEGLVLLYLLNNYLKNVQSSKFLRFLSKVLTTYSQSFKLWNVEEQ